jgi:hypothetical protein
MSAMDSATRNAGEMIGKLCWPHEGHFSAGVAGNRGDLIVVGRDYDSVE